MNAASEVAKATSSLITHLDKPLIEEWREPVAMLRKLAALFLVNIDVGLIRAFFTKNQHFLKEKLSLKESICRYL